MRPADRDALHIGEREVATGNVLFDVSQLSDEAWVAEASRKDFWARLDPAAVPKSRWSKFYARPLLWMARGQTDPLDEIVEKGAREELRIKVSRFIRSRWFEPPFSGEHFTELLLGAFEAMAETKAASPLLPPGQPLDLFVTVTDYHGYPERLRLHSPEEVMEV